MKEMEIETLEIAKSNASKSFGATLIISFFGVLLAIISFCAPQEASNAIGYTSVAIIAVSLILLFVTSRLFNRFRYLRNEHYARRDGVHPLANDERIKLNLLEKCTKHRNDGTECLDQILSYSTSMEPLSLICLDYRLTDSDYERIYEFLVRNETNLENDFGEYIPYSCFLFSLPFNAMALWAKGCLNVSDDDLLCYIKNYCEDNDAADIKRLIMIGYKTFKVKYGDTGNV